MGQVTVQQILQRGYAAFEQSHPLPDYVRKAAWALMACRTALLGGHVQSCPEGHIERVWYNSCKHRLCPPCAWLQIERWLVIQKARLLACEHYHLIFTMPSERHPLWLANVAVMTTLLFTSVRDTLLELLGDAKYLGATPGIIATLHTWSQTLRRHPHIHSLVTGGGLTRTGQWVAVRHGFLLPSRVVMALFRGKLLAAIRRALSQGQLQLPLGMRPQACANLLNKLGRQKWNVHIRERYPHGTGVLTYLARYLRGGPLANHRLVSYGAGEVTCRYRVNGETPDSPRSGLMTVPVAAFLRRDLPHVLPPGTRVVRAYGVYASSKGDDLAVCREQVGQGPVATPVVPDWQTAWRQHGVEHPGRCPRCGRLLVCSSVIPRASGPPAVDVCGERVA
jgi:Putative transposase/Transposase zinc-binding domain